MLKPGPKVHPLDIKNKKEENYQTDLLHLILQTTSWANVNLNVTGNESPGGGKIGLSISAVV